MNARTPSALDSMEKLLVPRLAGLVLLGALLFLAVACDDEIAKPLATHDDSFTVGADPRLLVDGENGSIVVIAGSDNTIRVQAALIKPSKLEYLVAQDGDTVTVEVDEKGSGIFTFGRSPSADIQVTVPPKTDVELRTKTGGIELTGVEGTGILGTSNGDVVVQGAKGAFDVETSNGSIDFNGEMLSGGKNRLRTSNGSVTVTLEGEPSLKLDASTSNGSVTSDLPVLTTSTGDANHLVGVIGNGDAELFIKTSNGSVTVR